MHILFLSQILPYPLDAGPKTRAYYVIRYLANLFRMSLVSFSRASDSRQTLSHLEGICEQIVTIPIYRSRIRDLHALFLSFQTGFPFLITRDLIPQMDEGLRALVQAQSFDVIHADQLWMAPYALKARQYAQKKSEQPRLVLDQHNAVHLIPQRMAANARNPLARWLLHREARLLRRFEAHMCQQFDHIVWVTQEDMEAVRKLEFWNSKSDTQNTVIPICIDPDEITPVEPLTREPLILFLGGMHWPPNAEGVNWFMREVFPLVKEQLPGAQFIAIGKSPPAETQNQPNVTAPGYVEDVEPYWRQSRVFVVPLRAGGGMRVKILDAWAHGLPVVSTTIGAEGLDYRAGEDILIADEPQQLADSLLQVLRQDNLAQGLAKAGRETVERCYNWRTVYKPWDEVYKF